MRLHQWHKLCLTAWLFLLFFFAAGPSAFAAQTATVNTAVLNVRAEAAATAQRIAQVAQGQQFPVLQTSGDWAQIRLTDGQIGWVLLQYVQVTVVADLPKSVTVSGNSVNVRSGPGTSFPVSGGVSKGAVLPVMALENGWYKVKLTAESSGWVSADYVTAPGSPTSAAVNQPAAPPVPAAPDKSDSPAAPVQPNISPPAVEPAVPATDGKGTSAAVADDRLKGLVVNASALNVRQGPSLTAKIITTVPQGTRMLYLGKSADWYQVTMDDNRQGWVSSALVSFSTEAVSSWISPKPKAPKKAADPDEDDSAEDDADGENSADDGNTADEDDEAAGDDDRDRSPGLANKTIVIDPGHGTVQSGWYDPGAIGSGGTQEADVVMDIAERLADLLDDAGADVVLTREGQTNLTLDGRTRVANELGADVFISIHANASTSSQLNGTTTYYYLTPVSGDAEQTACRKILATCLQDALVDQLERPDLGIRQENFAVLRTCNIPSALVETAFISNATEEELLQQSSFRRAAARGIFAGLEAYFQEIY